MSTTLRAVSTAFFARSALDLAPALLGVRLVHETPEGVAAGRIVEVEAYRGPEDRAAHSYGGRRTARTEVMYGPPGRAYVYQVYGMHFCLNVVAGPPGKPEAVLIRALEPVEGLELMARRRGFRAPGDTRPLTEAERRSLARGPARLCQALGITRAQYGWDLAASPLYLTHDADPVPEQAIARGPRIGIDYAGPDRDWPWRFWVAGSPWVSRG